MAQNTNLNVAPYFDDYNGDKNFHKVLFRPGYSIQSRELTTLQSILQDQVERFGSYQFKQGELVIPGEVGLNTRLDYVKLTSVSEVAVNVDGEIVFQKYDITQLVGETLVGLLSGVQCKVLDAQLQTSSSADTLFVSYISSGDSNIEETFRQGETVEVLNGVNTPTLVVGTDGTVAPTFIQVDNLDTGESQFVSSPAMGFASAVKIESGIYFVNGFFVKNSEQLVIVDPYNNKASGKVAFDIVESIVTPEEDNSLYDNARGSSNFASPGAHRLKVELVAKKYGYSEALDRNSIELLSIKNGIVEKKIRQKDFNLLEDTLARRTYDESGDYVVSNFDFDIREYYQKSDNIGFYALNSNTGLVNDLSVSEADAKLVGTIGPGKAYVKGYEIVNKETKYISLDKARDEITRANVTLKSPGYSSFFITNLYGSLPVNAEGVELTQYPTVYMFASFNDGDVGINGLTSDYALTSDFRGLLPSNIPNNVDTTEYDELGAYELAVATATDLNLQPSEVALKTIVIERSLNFLGLSVGGTIKDPDQPVIQAGDGYQVDDQVIALDGNGLVIQVTEVDAFGGIEDYVIVEAGIGYSTGAVQLAFSAPIPGSEQAVINIIVTNNLVPPVGSDLWFIKSVTSDGQTTTPVTLLTEAVRVVSSKIVKSEKIDSTLQTDYVECVVCGRRDILDALLVEYDAEDPDGRRRVFLTGKLSTDDAFIVNDIPANALGQERANYFFGSIVDYSDTFSPLVGISKPSNISFIETGDGFNPLSDKILSKGLSDQGQDSYNGIFKYDYFNPVFFTRLTLSDPSSLGFTEGKYVSGSKSGAFGVVEGSVGGYYSFGNVLHLRVQQGSFIPGETIVDEDGYSARIATNNTVSHFVVHNQGFNYSASSTVKLDGVSFDKSKISINTVGGGTSILNLTIEDDSVRTKEYTNPPTVTITNGSAANATAVLFKDTVYTYTLSNVNSFYSSYGSGTSGSNVFTADIETQDSSYATIGNITNFTFNGLNGGDYLEINALNVDLSAYVSKGDIVQYLQDNGVVQRGIVRYATTSVGNLKSRIYLSSRLRDKVTNSVINKITPKIDNPNATLVFPTGSQGVSSIVDDITDSKITYYFKRDFVATGSGTSGPITFAAQLPFGTQRFVTFSEENYVLTVLDPGEGTETAFDTGDIVVIKPEFVEITSSTDETSGLVAGSITITFPEGYFGSGLTTFPKVKLLATLEVSKAKPKLKTAVTNRRILVVPSKDNVLPLRGSDFDDTSGIGVASYSDVYKLRYVYEGTLTAPPSVDANGNLLEGKDITDEFVFDDGQRPSYYDVARIILKPGAKIPTGQIVIGFDYFEHSQGEFCTVDSYNHESGVPIDEIPVYKSPTGNISLRDAIDFRPKVDSTVVTSGFQDQPLLGSTNYISFNGEGGAPSVSIAPDNNLEFAIKFNESSFLDRIDALVLDKKGNFIVKKGNSSKNPSKPDIIEDTIPLYYIYLPALTENVADIKIVPVDNRRYTMKDIGKLEKRIDRLEYYTALSILEQQTLNMQIKDAFGFDRFKAGFLVDNFESHGVGKISSDEYACSIDSQQSVLRAQVYEDSLKLKETNVTNVERELDGYVLNNNIVTLPFTEQELLGNGFATTTVNPNPFVVLQYVGDIHIDPVYDDWYNQELVPLVTNNNTNLYSVYISKSNDPDNAFASIYDSFLINWKGVSSSFGTINNLSNLNTLTSESFYSESSIASSSNVSPNNNELAKGVSVKSSGDVYVSNDISTFTRSIPVSFVITRMKPNTRIYPFVDGRDVSRWVVPDSRFTGLASSSLTSFNTPVITDDNGNASGILVVPAGYPPLQGVAYPGDITKIDYDINAERIFLSSGQKTIKFTTSSTNEPKETVDSYAEISFYSTGLKPESPQSIVSTQPSYFKSNEGVQFVESNTDILVKPNPLSQTFKVEGYEGGVFVTSLDLYFNQKSNNIPLKVYLSDVSVGKPGKNIIPGTEVVILPKTYIRVFSDGSTTLKVGEDIVGSVSGCVGPLEKVLDKNGIELTLLQGNSYNITNEQVYTLVISNHNGREYFQGENITTASINSLNNTNNTNINLKVANDSGRLKSVSLESGGSNYQGAIITVESPQLPGGAVASVTQSIADGSFYDVDILISGSEYTSPPSIIIQGVGNGAAGAVIKSEIEIVNPAVRMGIAVDDGTTLDSKTPTRFKFDFPVYLLNDFDYAIQIETDSVDYRLWTSQLGEFEITTGINVSASPLLGSLYRSQNTDSWVEDLFEDLKFSLHRAKFDNTLSSTLTLKNSPVPNQKLKINPFEADASSNNNATSDLFRSNNKLLKVTQRNHGFEDRGSSYVFFNNVGSFSGINGSNLVKSLYTVDSSGIDTYTIDGPNKASATGKGGGDEVIASKNIKYEKLFADVANLQAPGTSINSTVRTTNIVPVDSNTQNYVSYSSSDFETTFLNQQQFFENQKVIASPINELKNSIDNSIEYRLSLNSDVDYLSPVVDLRNVSVKTSSQRIENPKGMEDRFGQRNQIIKLWPLVQFKVDNLSAAVAIEPGKSINGTNSLARGIIVKADPNQNTLITVRLQNDSEFISGEPVIFEQLEGAGSNDPNLTGSISTNVLINKISPSVQPFDSIRAYNITSQFEYLNVIDGKVLEWDAITEQLTVKNEYIPIENNYTGLSTDARYVRNSILSEQENDIFRVGDYVVFSRENTPQYDATTDRNFQIKSIEYTNGIDYRDDIEITQTSSIAKYLTKDISLDIPATSLDVRMSANVFDTSNVVVLYKVLESSSQELLETLKWNYMPLYTENRQFEKPDTIAAITEKQNRYRELQFYINDLPEYSQYAVKVVLKSDNPVFAPKLQDLRIVASF